MEHKSIVFWEMDMINELDDSDKEEGEIENTTQEEVKPEPVIVPESKPQTEEPIAEDVWLNSNGSTCTRYRRTIASFCVICDHWPRKWTSDQVWSNLVQ